MSKVVRVQDGDYKIVTQLNGTITLDTGNQIGTVIVTGDLLVQGNTTTVESETMTVKDNIIYLNYGEAGAGVSLGTSGLTIERGTSVDASFLWDESLTYSKPDGTSGSGAFKFETITGLPIGIKTNTVFSGTSDLRLDTGNTSGVVTVNPGYTARLGDPDDVPNIDWVENYVLASGGVAVVDRIYRYFGGSYLDTGMRAYDTGAGDGSSRLSAEVDGSIKMEINNLGVTVQGTLTVGDITISGNLVQTAVSNADLEFKGSGTGIVIVDDVLALTTQSAPSATAGRNKIYSGSIGTGGTGIKFVNTSQTGELISSKKALLYALLF